MLANLFSLIKVRLCVLSPLTQLTRNQINYLLNKLFAFGSNAVVLFVWLFSSLLIRSVFGWALLDFAVRNSFNNTCTSNGTSGQWSPRW